MIIKTCKILLHKLAGTNNFWYLGVEGRIILKLLLNSLMRDSGVYSNGSGAFVKREMYIRIPYRPGIFLISSSTTCFSELYQLHWFSLLHIFILNKDACNWCYSLSVTKSSRGQEPMMFSKVPKRIRAMIFNCST